MLPILPNSRERRCSLLVLLLALSASACSNVVEPRNGPPGPNAAVFSRNGPSGTFAAVSSIALQATVNTAVANLPSVVVKNPAGHGVPNVDVIFTVADGAGTLTGATQKTDTTGTATLGGWTLPTTVGQYTVTTTVEIGEFDGITFTATALPDAPAHVATTGDAQAALYGALLPTPLDVTVSDRYGNPTPGIAVVWQVVDGDGTVVTSDASTNAGGVARASYRLGT